MVRNPLPVLPEVERGASHRTGGQRIKLAQPPDRELPARPLAGVGCPRALVVLSNLTTVQDGLTHIERFCRV